MKYLAILLLALLIASCNTVSDEITLYDEQPDAEGFYTAQSGGHRLRYKVVSGGMLECELWVTTTGWLAVGFHPSVQMRDANFIIGNVIAGVGTVRDDWGNTASSHLPDTDSGGTNDVELISAVEQAGASTLRFRLPLNSGDFRDRYLQVGQSYPVIFASGSDDDLDSYHISLGSGTIKIRNP